MDAPRQPRLGRPPATSSAETRQRILDVARRLFAASGYEGTSNRALAEAAGLTTGAIYHYFESKLDIYRSVYAEAQVRVHERFSEAMDPEPTFAGRVVAMLETAHLLNREDPTLAQFLGTARIDARRDRSLANELRREEPNAVRRLFDDAVDLGIRTGEIDTDQREAVSTVLRVITTGLVDAVSDDHRRHRQAVDGFRALLDGKLIRPAP